MANPGLASRFMDLFQRQIAFYREALNQHERLAAELAGDDQGPLLDRQTRMAAEAQAFAAEFSALSGERDRTDPFSAEEYAALKACALEAKKLADALMRKHEEAVQMIGDRMGTLTDEGNELKKGLGLLRRYRPGSWDSGGFMDRQA
ncbi:MAG: hypothetical protein GY851_32010 [bacterium]|nr:hypothetical protein [bacterium]